MSIVVVIVAIAAGASLAAGGLFLTRPGDRFRWPIFLLSLIALGASIAVPFFVEAALPSAICQDSSNFESPLVTPHSTIPQAESYCTWEFKIGEDWFNPGQPTGPGYSFTGSSDLYGSSLAWGPALGWYLPIISAALLSAGTGLTSPQILFGRVKERQEVDAK